MKKNQDKSLACGKKLVSQMPTLWYILKTCTGNRLAGVYQRKIKKPH